MPKSLLSLRERFETFFEKRAGECWIWRGTKNEKGYGYFSVGGTLQRAHRVAYRLYVGPIPEGVEIMHSCHQKACVNFAHLKPGDRFENMWASRRRARGWRSPLEARRTQRRR